MSDPTSVAISKFLDKQSPITLSKLIIETQAPLILLFASLFIPSIILYVSINEFAVNIPIWDDYDIFLKYLNLTGDERLKFMFVQHNEHKVVFERFCAEVL
jgi:hypothetical protein